MSTDGNTVIPLIDGKAYMKRWHDKVVALLKHGLQADDVVLGGGQTKRLKKLPPGVRVASNHNAIEGGLRLWAKPRHSRGSRKPIFVPASSCLPKRWTQCPTT